MSTSASRPSACRLCFVLLAWYLLLSPTLVHGFSTGITGFSGKDEIFCSSCHGGGAPPLVRFEGPSEVAVGELATFRFVVQSQAASQRFGGFDVGVSDGTVDVLPGEGARRSSLFNEITHTMPKANDANGEAAWRFTWRAPSSTGAQTLFGAGNSVNGNGATSGDGSAVTTHVVSVVEAPPTATPTPSAPPSATFSPPPTATVTERPTRTPRPDGCTGDCTGDGSVTVDELVTGVNIALGLADLGDCVAFDANRNGAVTVDELVAAVSNALNGC